MIQKQKLAHVFTGFILGIALTMFLTTINNNSSKNLLENCKRNSWKLVKKAKELTDKQNMKNVSQNYKNQAKVTLFSRHKKEKSISFTTEPSLSTTINSNVVISNTTNKTEYNPYIESKNSTIADDLYEKVRILCWIITQPSNHKTKGQAVHDTWGKRCNKHIFITSKATTKSNNNTNSQQLPLLELDIKESRNILWTKTSMALMHIYDNFLDDFDFFIKADDDSYVILENLRFFLRNYSSEDMWYAGRQFQKYVPQGYMSGGGGYVLSRAAVRKTVEIGFRGNDTELTCDLKSIQAEDYFLGLCLYKLGVKVIPSVDFNVTERFHPLRLKDHLNYHNWDKSFWLTTFNKYPIKYRDECCSNLSVTFHYMTPQEIYELDFALYRLRIFGISAGCRDNEIIV